MSLFLSVVVNGSSLLWMSEFLVFGVAGREPLPCHETIACFLCRCIQIADKDTSAATALLLLDIVQV